MAPAVLAAIDFARRRSRHSARGAACGFRPVHGRGRPRAAGHSPVKGRSPMTVTTAPAPVSAGTAPASGSFAALGVPAPLLEALTAAGITSPSPPQSDTLPDTLAGRDGLGRGKTGSGKTLAFSIPMAAGLAQADGRSRAGHPRGL